MLDLEFLAIELSAEFTGLEAFMGILMTGLDGGEETGAVAEVVESASADEALERSAVHEKRLG